MRGIYPMTLSALLITALVVVLILAGLSPLDAGLWVAGLLVIAMLSIVIVVWSTSNASGREDFARGFHQAVRVDARILRAALRACLGWLR